MSRYLEREVQGDERVIYVADLHWIVYHFGALLLIAGWLIGNFGSRLAGRFMGTEVAQFVAFPLTIFAIGVIALGALHLLTGFIRQISTELIITNRRVISKRGFITTTTYEVMLGRVEGANINQSVAGRILGYGTVMVKGTGGGLAPIDHVANPYRFHAVLMKAMDEAAEERQVHAPAGRGEEGVVMIGHDE